MSPRATRQRGARNCAPVCRGDSASADAAARAASASPSRSVGGVRVRTSCRRPSAPGGGAGRSPGEALRVAQTPAVRAARLRRPDVLPAGSAGCRGHRPCRARAGCAQGSAGRRGGGSSANSASVAATSAAASSPCPRWRSAVRTLLVDAAVRVRGRLAHGPVWYGGSCARDDAMRPAAQARECAAGPAWRARATIFGK